MRLDMLEMAGEVGVKWTGRLLNVCMQEGRIPKEWMMGLIGPILKRKGDVHDPGNFKGIRLLSQVLKLLERVLDARIRRTVEGDFVWKNSKGSGRVEEQQTGCTSRYRWWKRDWRYRAVWLRARRPGESF